VLWFIGDIFADNTQKRLCIFYGPGSIEKSSVCDIIRQLIGDKCYNIESSALIMTQFQRPINILEIALNAACSRLAIPTVDRRAPTTRGTFKGTSDAKKELIMHALTMHVNYALPPMTTYGLLHSLFHVIYSDVCNIVKMEGDSSNMDCILATIYLCVRYDISFSDLQMCLILVGTCCCIIYEKCLFIHGIRPIPGASIRHVPKAPVDARHGRYNRGQPVIRVTS